MWNITGRLVPPPGGAYTLRYRQSSLEPGADGPDLTDGCGHSLANAVASSVVVHGVCA
jgi:hypothetical protein